MALFPTPVSPVKDTSREKDGAFSANCLWCSERTRLKRGNSSNSSEPGRPPMENHKVSWSFWCNCFRASSEGVEYKARLINLLHGLAVNSFC